MRILLIEDEPEMASVLKTALERRDVVVDHVSTLADAEAMAKFGPLMRLCWIVDYPMAKASASFHVCALSMWMHLWLY